jgi:hypothetical protein
MTINYTTLLGLAQPVTGTEANTWGTAVNDEITALLDTAVAGTTTLSADADVTLTTTAGAANQARQAIILWTASGSTTRNITAPAQSKTYMVINATGSTQSIVLRGVGPTTGITIVAGEKCVAAWNGSDFVKVANQNGIGNFTTLNATTVDATNIEVTDLKAKDGTASITLADSTGIATFSKATVISTTDNTNAALRITQLGSGNALLVEDSTNPDSTPFVISNNGSVIVGKDSALTNYKVDISTAGEPFSTAKFVNSTAASLHLFAKSRSTTPGTYSILSSGDGIASLNFAGDDGTAFIPAASISSSVDGTPGTNDMPGRLVFSTTADGASTVTERMRINNAGNVGIGTTGATSMLQTAGTSAKSAFKTPNIAEVATVSATAATGTIAYDVTTQSVLYYTTDASGNFTVNFRGSSGTSLDTVMSTGESISATFLVTNGATAYYNSAVQVDGSSVTPKWQGGSAPTSGNASSIDSYTYVIIKTGSATFTVLASVTKFA